MDKPVIADRKPKHIQLEAGKDYLWCACGRSKSQPFCDGSHAGTSFKPLAFKPEKDGDAALCVCKRGPAASPTATVATRAWTPMATC